MHGFAVVARAALVALCCAAAPAARAQSCPTAATTSATLASVGPRLELRLADGRLLRLAGIEAAAAMPTTPDREARSVGALAALLDRRPLSVTVLSPKPDRWGRLAAFASLPDGPVGGLAAVALAAGLARYRPEPAASACRAALLAAEDKARQARLGLWADPAYAVLSADDDKAFAARAGSDVVVEAKLRGVEPGTYRTTLRLEGAGASTHGRLLDATIAPRVMKVFVAQGVDVKAMVGRTLRLRGLLDRRFGPRIELAGPDEIEILPETTAPAPAN
jgi:endonuclease YncB( thermonuclease family)